MRQVASRVEWRRRVAELDASGMSVRDFAAGQRLNPVTLGWWRSAFKREGVGGASSNASGTSSGHRFVPVVVASPAPSDARLEVELPNGIIVRATGIGPAALASFVAALR